MMQDAVTNVLKSLMSSIFSSAMTSEEVLEDFYKNSEIALDSEHKQDLLDHLKKYVS